MTPITTTCSRCGSDKAISGSEWRCRRCATEYQRDKRECGRNDNQVSLSRLRLRRVQKRMQYLWNRAEETERQGRDAEKDWDKFEGMEEEEGNLLAVVRATNE